MERRRQRKFCPAGVPLANRREITSGVPDPESPQLINTKGQRLLLTTTDGREEIVNPEGACGFETVGENLNSADCDVGTCSFCLAKCIARKARNSTS